MVTLGTDPQIGDKGGEPSVPPPSAEQGASQEGCGSASELKAAEGVSPLSPKSPPFYPVGSPAADEGGDADEEPSAAGARLVLKFLVGTEAAGAIIGKHGATVGELESSSGVKIQLSRTHEYFPGTAKRTVALCGTLDQALVALYLCLTKVEADGVTMLGQQMDGPSSQIALVVPDSVCGSIIGRGGSTLKSFMEDSGAKLVVSSNDRCGERLIYITGDKDQQVRAAALVGTQMAQHPAYNPEDVPLSYPMVHTAHHEEEHHHSASHHAADHHHHHHQRHSEDGHQDHQSKSYTLPDECVGVVIGKHGATIQLIRDRTGALVKVEDSNGSGSRKVTATGSPAALEEVDHMLLQLVTAWGIQDGPVDGRSSLDGGHRRGSMDLHHRSSGGSRRGSLDGRHHRVSSPADQNATWRSSSGDAAPKPPTAGGSRLSMDSRRSQDHHHHHHHHHHHRNSAHGQGDDRRRSADPQANWKPPRASLDAIRDGTKAAGVLQKHWPDLAKEPDAKMDESKVMQSSFYS